MKLDFSGLDSIRRGDEEQQAQPEQAYKKLDKKQQERQAIAETYKRQQEAILKSELLRHELVKGLRENAQPIDLLLRAIEIIGLMVGDGVVLNGIAKEYATHAGREL